MTTPATPDDLQHIARAFSRSRVLLTGVELDLFTLLAGRPLSAEEVVGELDSDLRATTIFLDALAAMGLLVKEEGTYRTQPSLVPALSKTSPESIVPGLLHSAHLWQTWSRLTETVLHGGPARKGESWGEERTAAFIGAMHVHAARHAPEVARAVQTGKARSLLDVGGGSGSYTIAFLRASPAMRATLFDLPEVIPMARERLTQADVAYRVTLVAGDYNRDGLPAGHDLAFLSAIIHQNSHGENVALYRKVFQALDPGGRIVVRDYAMSTDRIDPASGALFAVNMLVNTEGGNSYTYAEIREGL